MIGIRFSASYWIAVPDGERAQSRATVIGERRGDRWPLPPVSQATENPWQSGRPVDAPLDLLLQPLQHRVGVVGQPEVPRAAADQRLLSGYDVTHWWDV